MTRTLRIARYINLGVGTGPRGLFLAVGDDRVALSPSQARKLADELHDAADAHDVVVSDDHR